VYKTVAFINQNPESGLYNLGRALKIIIDIIRPKVSIPVLSNITSPVISKLRPI